MKKAVVILNGEIKVGYEIYNRYSNTDSYDIFCADGGANHAFELGIIPKLIIGDFDSINKKVLEHFKNMDVTFEKFPKSKDFTDGELIIGKIYDQYEEIIVLGGQGGRTDHFLSNLFLIEKYPKIKFVNHKEEIFFVKNGKEFINKKGATISFIPIDKEVTEITLTGFEYPLANYNTKRGSSITMSNIIMNDSAKITFSKGKLLAIINY